MRILLLVLVNAAAAWAAQQESTRDFQKTLPLAPGQKLTIDHEFGEIIVRGAAQKDVVIRATLRAAASSKEEADRMLNAIEVQADAVAGGVAIKTKYPEQRGWGRNASYSVSFDITMPDSALLDVRNRFGGVQVSDVKANTQVRGAHGRLSLRNGKGTHQLENSFGPVEVAGNTGDVAVRNSNGSIRASDVTGSLDVNNSFGAVTLERTGQNVTVVNGNGSITVTDAGGEARLTSSFGTITASGVGRSLTVNGTNGSVKAVKVGGPANVRTNFGSIDLIDVAGAVDAHNANGAVKVAGVKGLAKLHTTFGNITALDVAGPLDVTNSNGSIQATVASSGACNPVTLRTTFGTVKVGLPEPANYSVAASTTFGKIRSDFPLTGSGQISSESLTGKIGNGGCDLKITSSNGSVEIVKAAKP